MKCWYWGTLLGLLVVGCQNDTSEANDGGGTGGSVTGLLAPIEPSEGSGDTRPTGPDWKPPFELRAPGWRDTRKRICQPHHGNNSVQTTSIWSDDRGVFVLHRVACVPLLGRTSCEGNYGWTLQFNDGTGWSSRTGAESLEDPMRLTGFPSGPLLLVGDRAWLLDDEGTLDPVPLPEPSIVQQAYVVDEDQAYLLTYDLTSEGSNILFRYAAGEWTPAGTVPRWSTGLWADHDHVIAVGPDQDVLVRQGDGEFSEMSGLPAGNHTSVWAVAADNLWTGGDQGITHYDGSSWKVVHQPLVSQEPFVTREPLDHIRFWSDGSVLFYLTGREFGRIDGDEVDVLLSLPEDYEGHFTDLWGNSANEVFLSLFDSEFDQFACGGQFLLWFDGSNVQVF